MLEELKKEVLEANLELPKRNLVKYTWGNVSGIDREKGLFVIKPSGVDYEKLTYQDMVVVDLEGNVVEGDLNPSSDTPTHKVLYNKFKKINGIVHTHSPWATIWAEAGQNVTAMGTTHADTFYGEVPCARYLNKDEVERAYEEETGKLIVEVFEKQNIDPMAIPGILLHGHASFTWGKSPKDAVMNNVVLDEICKMNLFAKIINPNASDLPQYILDKHYLRKHGANAYYGQKN
ncbi:L-ribulose-5-phosphate 4-epimerase [Ligilactobacillus salivarius]|uniref:L-ribulose-5-phosphate 4-epimerase n=1 Tax=Ligilactobacillus salivarius TaxID=1624 RepID=UPI00195E0624|nr:L-ribulose-5-phosphate 4-epimerase [Ligilactobacillus salivarius]MBM6708865.1 L-ribulose-5-phosphate 4-epimerase [Ligilactobacillus salivarius]